MTSLDLALYAMLALVGAQGVFMLPPQRFAALELWKYRVIGARTAEPGRGTFRLYRFLGAAICAAVVFILIKFVPE